MAVSTATRKDNLARSFFVSLAAMTSIGGATLGFAANANAQTVVPLATATETGAATTAPVLGTGACGAGHCGDPGTPITQGHKGGASKIAIIGGVVTLIQAQTPYRNADSVVAARGPVGNKNTFGTSIATQTTSNLMGENVVITNSPESNAKLCLAGPSGSSIVDIRIGRSNIDRVGGAVIGGASGVYSMKAAPLGWKIVNGVAGAYTGAFAGDTANKLAFQVAGDKFVVFNLVNAEPGTDLVLKPEEVTIIHTAKGPVVVGYQTQERRIIPSAFVIGTPQARAEFIHMGGATAISREGGEINCADLASQQLQRTSTFAAVDGHIDALDGAPLGVQDTFGKAQRWKLFGIIPLFEKRSGMVAGVTIHVPAAPEMAPPPPPPPEATQPPPILGEFARVYIDPKMDVNEDGQLVKGSLNDLHQAVIGVRADGTLVAIGRTNNVNHDGGAYKARRSINMEIQLVENGHLGAAQPLTMGSDGHVHLPAQLLHRLVPNNSQAALDNVDDNLNLIVGQINTTIDKLNPQGRKPVAAPHKLETDQVAVPAVAAQQDNVAPNTQPRATAAFTGNAAGAAEQQRYAQLDQQQQQPVPFRSSVKTNAAWDQAYAANIY